ncbi:Uncharacterised protein [Vibrio cholerae]|nr:Uncharacterised protein [Vibrio cholerae]
MIGQGRDRSVTVDNDLNAGDFASMILGCRDLLDDKSTMTRYAQYAL